MEFQTAHDFTIRSIDFMTTSFNKLPGSIILVRYIQSSYQNDPFRSAIELVLLIFFIRYLTSSSYKSRQPNFVVLTEDEIDDLVDQWVPEPLVAEVTDFEESVAEKLPVIIGPAGPKCKLANGRTVMNLASHNFYNFAGDEIVKKNAIETLRKYGVGPCSAPQFYGTQDVHTATEARIAAFMGTESCIIYAHTLSMMTSIICTFAKRGDIIVADNACNYSIRKGLEICRSKVKWYQHGDMEDLERVLQNVVRESKKSKVLTRRFIITEGLSEFVGDVVDLPKIVELKMRYKFRLILDETLSIGVLGRTGRGVTESQSVDVTQVDILAGSMSGPLSAAGGFCASSMHVVEHQRITSPAYTYSCALPAMLATTAAETISMIENNPEVLTICRDNISTFRTQLVGCKWVDATSASDNPIQLFALNSDIVNAHLLGVGEQDQIMQDTMDEILAKGILVTRLKSITPLMGAGSQDSAFVVRPALKVCITTGLAKKEIEKAGTTIRQAIAKVMLKRTSGRLGSPASI